MATQAIPLELDDTWFTVVASSPAVILTQHKISGALGLWRLEWRDRGDFPKGFEGDAWAAYMRAQTDAT